MVKFYFDPGHGGTDPGAVGHGIHEADIVLDIAKRVQSKLLNYENVQVKLSRTTDKFLELRERTNDANKWGADALISIHINASTRAGANGIETWIYTNGSNQSLIIASAIQGHLIRETNRDNRGVKKGNLHMVRASDMAACLVECGFISNKEEAGLMKTDKFLNQCADAIEKGLVEVYKLKAKPTKTVAKKQESVQIRTGGLSPAMVEEVTKYFKEKGWWAQVQFTKDKNPTAITGGLDPSMRQDFEKWLKERNWWYTIL